MLSTVLNGKTAAILAKDGFAQCELLQSRDALTAAGIVVHIVSIEPGTIIAWDENQWGIEVEVDKTLKNVSAEDYDALILPGGLFNPDVLVQNKDAVDFVRGFFNSPISKPVVAINQGAWMLMQANVLRNRMVTLYPDVLNRLRNAGAKPIDRDLVVDKDLFTSRTSANLVTLNQQVIEHLSEPLRH